MIIQKFQKRAAFFQLWNCKLKRYCNNHLMYQFYSNEEIKLTECATYGNLQEAKKLSDKANDANYEQIDVDM